ncbi:MAG: purine-nucleoside phosphorylase [Saprospiraceae bacterium]|nr:purine-nucleoside phosphorylase [Saprospiraceae bacterium]
MKENINAARDYIRNKYKDHIQVGVILGTGMSTIAREIEDSVIIPYGDIPHFPVSTVESHRGELILGKIGGTSVALLAGRFHYYEGYSMQQITFPVRVFDALGIKSMVVTNASGGLNPSYAAGDIIVITDHINLFPDNPLRGPNDPAQGLRFPDMMKAYPEHLVEKMKRVASELNISVKEGVYAGWQGPSMETPAEYRFLNRIGADMIGMSTIPEVIVAKHCELDVLAMSIVSNQCFPIEDLEETTLDEVIETVGTAAPKLRKLLIKYLGDFLTEKQN